MARRAKSQSFSNDQADGLISKAALAKTPPAKPLTSSRPVSRRSPVSPPPGAPSAFTPIMSTSPRKSQIPASLQFPLLVIMSFAFSSLLYSVIAEFTAGDLAAVSRHSESILEITALLAWKVVLLGVCWFGGFDAYDTLALTLLITTPQAILLGLFFAIRPTTLVMTALAFTASSALPFALLRPVAPTHHPSTAAHGSLRNRPILTDPWTSIATSALAAAIFAVLLELAFATFLPTWLVMHFDHVRSLSAAHLGAAGLPGLLLALLPAGYAAHEFLFTTSTGVVETDLKAGYHFDPATSGFVEHVYHNAWGWYSERQKELIGRTGLLAMLVFGETVVQTWGTLPGVELAGALGYAGLWSVGIVTVGAVFDWVGGPSG